MSWTTVQEYLDDPGGYEAHRGVGHDVNETASSLGVIVSSTLVPPIRARLVINENLMVEFVKPMPGRWHRLWYRLLLGWRWEAT